jgi:hypothetical protein
MALPLETIKRNYEKTTGQTISIEELDKIITKLMDEGLVFEEEPLKYRRIQVARAKPIEEKKEEKTKSETKKGRKITFMDLKGKVRFTKLGNVEIRVIIPVNYLRRMFNLPKKEREK